MAHYPADTFQEATEIAIEASNQLHGVINGDANAEVTVEDGSKIPSVRKAMVDSLYFKPPIAWAQGEYEDTYNQLREFVDGDVRTWWFAKGATVSTPVLMTTNPAIDVNWTLWSAVTLNAATYETQKRLAAEAGLNMVGSFLLGATVTTTKDVVFYETDGKYYGWAGAFPKVVAAGATPATSGGIGAGAWVDRTDVTLRGDLASDAGASYVTTVHTAGEAVARSVLNKLSDFTSVKDFGALGDGVNDDGPAIQLAINSGVRNIFFPTGIYKITTPIVISADKVGLKLSGASPGSVNITTTNDIELFQDHGIYTLYEGMVFTCTNAVHSKMHIQFYSAERPSIIDCLFNGTDSQIATGSGVGFGDGAGGVGGTMGVIDRCVFNHASINVLTWDVHITNSWIWANSRRYGIKAEGSVGNLTITGCDILPPVITRGDRSAGIYLSGAVTQPIISACYIDGNPTLATGVGILAEDGVLGLSIDSLRANQNCQEVIILDSVINPVVKGCTFMAMNRVGLGAHGVLLRQTFAQAMLNPIIRDNTFIQTTTITGTLGSAIYVDSGVSRNRIVIEGNSIYQPGAGGGFLDQEINLVGGAFGDKQQGSLRGNSSTRKKCMVNAVATFIGTDTYKDIPLNTGGSLMYAPRIDQIRVNCSVNLPYAVQLVDANVVRIIFTAGGAIGAFYVSVDLD